MPPVRASGVNLSSALDRKFLFVVGKGGVGKSTVSAALALAAARQGRSVLVAMCNAKERLSHLLDTDPIGSEISNLHPGIDAVNMEPAAALEEYGMMVLKVRALYNVIFENRFVSAFLRGTPGLDAWAMLGKAQFHAFESDRNGRGPYDLVIVDAPATGHGLDLLRVPKVILDVAPPGPLRKEAQRAWELFSDPQRAGVVLVTLPEELPVNETIELNQAIEQELKLPVQSVVINRLLPRLFSAEERPLLAALRAQQDDATPLGTLARFSAVRAEREALEAGYVKKLQRAIAHEQVCLPALAGIELRLKEVEELSLAFDPD